jgi:hypothetical protein
MGTDGTDPAAMVDLGDLLREQGDAAGARAAFEKAIETGHKTWAHVAVAASRRDETTDHDAPG